MLELPVLYSQNSYDPYGRWISWRKFWNRVEYRQFELEYCLGLIVVQSLRRPHHSLISSIPIGVTAVTAATVGVVATLLHPVLLMLLLLSVLLLLWLLLLLLLLLLVLAVD